MKFGVLAGVVALSAARLQAQDTGEPTPFIPPPGQLGVTRLEAQRAALRGVFSAAHYLRNAARTGPRFNAGVYEMLGNQYQLLCDQFAVLKSTLSPEQEARSGDKIADLDEGLDIIGQAFGPVEVQINAGQSSQYAVTRMCRVVDEAVGVWEQELARLAARLNLPW